MDQSSKGDIATKDAKYGEKMIEIKVRFWTNNIADSERILPKPAWSGGVVRIAGNKSHSIVPGHPKPFNSLLDLGSAIERVLIEHGIVLLPSDRMTKYMADRPAKSRVARIAKG